LHQNHAKEGLPGIWDGLPWAAGCDRSSAQCCCSSLPPLPLHIPAPPLQAQSVCAAALDRLSAFNRRTLDVLGARLYSYWSLAHERRGSLSSIRSALLGAHRTAVLRHDDVGAETLLNLLLRNYLAYNLYDQVRVCVFGVGGRPAGEQTNGGVHGCGRWATGDGHMQGGDSCRAGRMQRTAHAGPGRASTPNGG
jgi:hypothetical protein